MERSSEKEANISVSLRDLLISLSLSPSLAIGEEIKSIDLGLFGKEAEDILYRSLKDRGMERGKQIIVKPDRSIYLQINDIVGEELKDGMKIVYAFSARQWINQKTAFLRPLQDKYRTGDLHSHGKFNILQSPNDLYHLFLKTTEPDAGVFSFVVTPKRKCLIFRGSKTPQWEREFIKEKIHYWGERLHERVQKHLGWPNKTEVINDKANYALLRSIANTYDLKVFICAFNKNIAVRQKTEFDSK